MSTSPPTGASSPAWSRVTTPSQGSGGLDRPPRLRDGLGRRGLWAAGCPFVQRLSTDERALRTLRQRFLPFRSPATSEQPRSSSVSWPWAPAPSGCSAMPSTTGSGASTPEPAGSRRRSDSASRRPDRGGRRDGLDHRQPARPRRPGRRVRRSLLTPVAVGGGASGSPPERALSGSGTRSPAPSPASTRSPAGGGDDRRRRPPSRHRRRPAAVWVTEYAG